MDRKLLVSNGAERTILDKLKGKGAKSRSGGDKGVGGAGGKGSHCVVEPGVDYPGGSCNQHSCVGSDIRFVRGVSDPGACCLLCQKESKCAYWTYASMEIEHVGQKQVCWLKTADARSFPSHVASPPHRDHISYPREDAYLEPKLFIVSRIAPNSQPTTLVFFQDLEKARSRACGPHLGIRL